MWQPINSKTHNIQYSAFVGADRVCNGVQSAQNEQRETGGGAVVCPVTVTAFDIQRSEGSSWLFEVWHWPSALSRMCRRLQAETPLDLLYLKAPPSPIATAIIRRFVTTSRNCILQHDSVFRELIIIIKRKRQSRFLVDSAMTSQFPLLTPSRNRHTCKWSRNLKASNCL